MYLALLINCLHDSPLLCLLMPWLRIFYHSNVTNVSHQQPHGPTFKTTASTVPHHFHLLLCPVCVCVCGENGGRGVCECYSQLPKYSRNLDSIIAQERRLRQTLAGAAKCGGKGRSGFKCLSVSLWMKQMFGESMGTLQTSPLCRASLS